MLNNVEMRCFRKMQRKSWTQKSLNEKVPKIGNVKGSPLKSIRKRQLEFLGQELEHLLLKGKVDGSRACGRQRQTFMSHFQGNANHLIQMTQVATNGAGSATKKEKVT